MGVVSRTSATLLDIFTGLILYADSVFPPMNIVTSRDQFKPIRLGENLVVNYNYYIITVQSTLALRTPRYYGHPDNTYSS